MSSMAPQLPLPSIRIFNEPVLSYELKTRERLQLESTLEQMSQSCEDIPIVIGSKEFRTKSIQSQVMPFDHKHKIATFYHADESLIKLAMETATKAQKHWDRTSYQERFRIWEKAVHLMAHRYRYELNAATMLGQGKTVIQAELDAACELIDFMRWNPYFLMDFLNYQPFSPNPKLSKNTFRLRGIEGFVGAITPFNFTAIGGNLALTPALTGNCVLWKPSDTAILSNWTIFKIMREAGLPPGVVNFVPSNGPTFGELITQSPDLAGINFTGSVQTFQNLWKDVGKNVSNYKNFPRLIGECGGKNYHFVHPSADRITAVAATIRSAFEYSGQKCSACSRAYIPKSLWPEMKHNLLELRSALKITDARDFTAFSSAVIDEKSFDRINSYLEHAEQTDTLKIIGGGDRDKSKGYFVGPTIVVTTDPDDKLMTEEIFGPILCIYVYDDDELLETIKLVKRSKYALTGAVFALDMNFVRYAYDQLRMTAGNFYINDKSTGSVVGQQPFGGARHSGTNDKAGGPLFVLRWTSPQTIKQTYAPSGDVFYPYMFKK
ncbi:hypothetical protein HA402_007782 [Bradysia odoriphaga]|nr:hypothetical protein HA402_007782 [Bradysia odoriphaga]